MLNVYSALRKPSDTGLDNKSSATALKGRSFPATDSRSSLADPSVTQMDFKPNGGVTFLKNNHPDVAIVGKGYGEDSHAVEPKPSSHAQKAKERRKPYKSKRRYFMLLSISYNSFTD